MNSTVPYIISMAQYFHGTALLWRNILCGVVWYIIVIMVHCYYGTVSFPQQIRLYYGTVSFPQPSHWHFGHKPQVSQARALHLPPCQQNAMSLPSTLTSLRFVDLALS